jgi:hypothetical protein
VVVHLVSVLNMQSPPQPSSAALDNRSTVSLGRVGTQRFTVWGLCCLAVVLGSCSKPEESVTEVKNGAFKIVVRSQEFHHSAIRNIDICVAEATSREFPQSKAQCFFHGFDFSGLSVRWQAEREIEVYFRDGRVTYFMNCPSVSPVDSVPVGFHAILCDGCDPKSNLRHFEHR